MAMGVVINARIEGMKAANVVRQENGHALAYNRAAFLEAEEELSELIRTQIGFG